ncbi:MAG: hypothetical protein WCF85_20020 [Rhodospirillaceae bacterium]
MFSVGQEDIVAVRRAFMAGGRDRALVELKRRYLMLNDTTAPDVLDRMLEMPVDMPPAFSARTEPRRDSPGTSRKKKTRDQA